MISNMESFTWLTYTLAILTAHLLLDINLNRYSAKKHSVIFKKTAMTLTLLVMLYLSLIIFFNKTGSTSFAGYFSNEKTFVMAQMLDDPVVLSRFHEYVLNVYKNQMMYIDGVSLSLSMSTIFFTCLIFMSTWRNVMKSYSTFMTLLSLTNLLMTMLFSFSNMFMFSFMFELMSVPLISSMYMWGPRSRKKRAISYLYFYSTISMMLMFMGASLLSSEFNSLNNSIMSSNLVSMTRQNIISWSSLMPFMVKSPSSPFHLWLPEAHVEGPTFASVLLAAMLLKLAMYGMYRFILFKFEKMFMYYQLFIIMSLVVSAVYAALTTLRQNDMKRMMAYSSMVHSNFSLSGFSSYSVMGFKGTLLSMIAHALSSSALFMMVGQIYNRTQTKNIFYINGLTKTAPLLSGFLLLFTLANTGFPFTVNFMAELLIMVSLAKLNMTIMFISAMSLFISTVYSFWLFSRISFNSNSSKRATPILDLNRNECMTLMILAMPVMSLGVYPNLILQNW